MRGRLAGSGLAKSAAGAGIAMIVSGLSGFARQAALAWTFNAGRSLDSFFIAQTVSQTIFGAFDSALTSAMIGVYVARRAEGEAAAARYFRSIALFVLMVSTCLSAATFVFSGDLVRAFAPGFDTLEAKQTAGLIRVMCITIITSAVGAVMNGRLQAEGKFVMGATMFVPRNLLVMCACVISPMFGLWGVAWSMVAGSLAQIGLLGTRRRRTVGRPVLGYDRKAVATTLVVTAPLCLSYLAAQTAVVVDRLLASYLPSGTISTLSLALALVGFVQGILVIGASVAYPEVMKRLTRGAHREAWALERAATWTLLGCSTLVAVALAILAPDAIRLVYGHGRFAASGVLATYFSAMLPMIVFATGSALQTRVLAGTGQSWRVVWAALVGGVFTVSVDVLLVHSLGAYALILGGDGGTAAALIATTIAARTLRPSGASLPFRVD